MKKVSVQTENAYRILWMGRGQKSDSQRYRQDPSGVTLPTT
jgi:hypothetical protein